MRSSTPKGKGSPISPMSTALRYTPVGEIPTIVSRLRRTYQNRILFPATKRRQLLQKVVDMVNENRPLFHQALYSDLHKATFETDVNELNLITNEAFEMIGHLDSLMAPKSVEKDLALAFEDCTVQKDPLGVVLIIGAWNYPAQLTLLPLVGALAAGNCVLIKPSELSPESARVISELIARYFDPSEVAVVNGGVAETTAVLQERFDHILYTGNGRVARIVMAAAAKNLTPVTLELGGKSPCIVDETADLKVSARRIAWGRLVNAGQTCVAPDYLLVKTTIKDSFLRELKQAFVDFLGEDPKMSPDYARIVSDMHFKRIVGLMAGGTVIFGGQSDPSTRYIAPTILDNVDLNSSLMTDEIFGPLLPVIPFSDNREAIDFINARDKPLALYIFSKNTDYVKSVQRLTSSGAIVVNDTLMHAAVPGLPFGGVGESGMGFYHGKHSFDTFSHKKAVMKRQFMLEGLNNMRYPPYTASKQKMLRRLGLVKTGPAWSSSKKLGVFVIVLILIAAIVTLAVSLDLNLKK